MLKDLPYCMDPGSEFILQAVLVDIQRVKVSVKVRQIECPTSDFLFRALFE